MFRASAKQAEAGDVIFGNIDSFLTWHLTGGPDGGLHITDVTNASRTQLMDLDTLSWDRELLDAFGIPEAMLPRICSSGEVYGTVKAALRREFRSQEFSAISKPRWWARHASNPAKRKTPTAPAAFC